MLAWRTMDRVHMPALAGLLAIGVLAGAAYGAAGGEGSGPPARVQIQSERETAAGVQEEERPGLVRRMYDWTIHWAETPLAIGALFVLAFAEASFFPIPPDVLLMAMAIATPAQSLWYAAVCLVGSVLGGCLGYAIGAFFFKTVGERIIDFYRCRSQFERLSARFGHRGFLFVFIAALTPIPYKVFTITAGVCRRDISLKAVVLASVAGRGLRFFALGLVFQLGGKHVGAFIDRYFNVLTMAFAVLLVGGFLCVKLFTGRRAHESGPAGAEDAGGIVSPD